MVKAAMQKHQGKATYAGVMMAALALGSAGLEAYAGKDGKQDQTASQIKMVLVRELAVLKEWKKAATKDLEVMEAEHKKMMGQLAALNAVVKLLTEGRRTDARVISKVVTESLAAPAPAPPGSDATPISGIYEVIEVVEERAHPRARPKTVARKKMVKSSISASRKIEIGHEQVQQHMQDLFPEMMEAE